MTPGSQTDARGSAWNRFVRGPAAPLAMGSRLFGSAVGSPTYMPGIRLEFSTQTDRVNGEQLLMGGWEAPRIVTSTAKDETA